MKATQMQTTVEAVMEWGIKVEKIKLQDKIFGYLISKENHPPQIILNANKNDITNFVTLLHELAHLFLGHTSEEKIENKTTKKPIKITKRELDTNTEELEAETACYLITQRMGITSHSDDYLAGYLEGKKTVEEILATFSYETVIKVADKIQDLFC